MTPDASPSPAATTPGAPLPPGVSERFVEAGGIRFRYLHGGQTTGLPLVLLHGWPTWAEVWLPVVQVLGAGHPWIALDLPGQGKSSPLPRGDRTLPSSRRAVAACLDALGIPRYALIGNSMGGSLAIMIALDRPSRVEKVVVLDAAGLNEKFPGRTVRMYAPFLIPAMFRAPGPRTARKLLSRLVFNDPRFADDAWVNSFVEAWKPRERRRPLIDSGFALRRKDASVFADLPQLKAPTLVLSGREDVQFTWQSAEANARRIPNAKFAAIDGAGHFPMVEKPAETARLISEFLDSS